MTKRNGKKNMELEIASDGTADRTYNITGSGEVYYRQDEDLVPSENGFSQPEFERMLRTASRRTSARESRTTRT